MVAIHWELRRHQVAIAGTVVNRTTGKPVACARVKIVVGSGQMVTLTGPDGHFHFLDLPAGTYPLTVNLPAAGSRFGIAQGSATVSLDGSGDMQMAIADMQLPVTTISGVVRKPNHKPAVMAEVRLSDSGERIFTDADGRYALVGVEIGSRTLTVTTQKFQPQMSAVTIATAGDTVTVDVTLTPF